MDGVIPSLVPWNLKLGTRNSRRAGVVLLLLSGVVGILLLLAMALLQMTRGWARASEGRTTAVQARLAAAGGIEYASARLIQDSLPGRRDVPGRGDDWTERQGSGVSGQGSDNPSYSHGESWEDDGDGIHEPGEAFGDRDRDGRFTGYSGRLRGGRSAWSLRFALRVDPLDGRIPVNAGHVGEALSDGIDNDGNGTADDGAWSHPDGADNDGDGSVDEPDEAGEGDLDGPGGGGNGIPDHRDTAAPYHAALARVLDNLGSILPIGKPQLGTHLITSRLFGGYRSWDQVGMALLPLGYTQADLEAIRPHLDLGPYGLPSEGGRCDPKSSLFVPRYVPVNLWTASREILTALWWNAGGSGIDLVEAGRLADAAIEFRKGGPQGGWFRLRRHLNDEGYLIFQEVFALPPLPGPVPAAVQAWERVAQRANLAFQLVAEDAYPGPDPHPSALWATWGIDGSPDAKPGGIPGLQLPNVVGLAGLGQPEGLSLAPPLRFSVESFAGGAAFAGTLKTADCLRIGCQEDFENLAGGIHLREGVGIRIAPETPADIRLRRDAANGYSPDIVTLPRWNRRSLLNPSAPFTVINDPLKAPLYGFSRGYGTVGLGTEDGAIGIAQIYFPFTEDFDPQNKDPLAVPPWKEFWSETSGVFPIYLPPYRYTAHLGLEDSLSSGPYGFTDGDPSFWTRGAWLNGTGWQVGWVPYLPMTATSDWQRIVSLSIGARMGVGSKIEISRSPGVLRIYTRRGFRPPDVWGTEYVVWCRWLCYWGNYAQKTRAWLVPDSKTNGAWSSHVHFTLERVQVSGVNPKYKTQMKLYVNGDNNSGSSDGPMDLLFDARENSIQSPPIPWPNSQDGEMRVGWDCLIKIDGVDELRFYPVVAPAPAAQPRYVTDGEFLSPLYVLDAPGRLVQAQWTGVSSSGGGIAVEATGFRNPDGTGAFPPVDLGGAGDVTDLSGAGAGLRSFRYKVTLLRDPSVDEPPLFESIWLTLQRRGHAPAWAAWESR